MDLSIQKSVELGATRYVPTSCSRSIVKIKEGKDGKRDRWQAIALEAARQCGVKKFVYASSSSVYGDSTTLPKKEGGEGNLLSPYALTKRTDEEYGKLYHKLYGLDTYGLRYFNVFGRRQSPDGAYAAVIPKFLKLLINDEQPMLVALKVVQSI